MRVRVTISGSFRRLRHFTICRSLATGFGERSPLMSSGFADPSGTPRQIAGMGASAPEPIDPAEVDVALRHLQEQLRLLDLREEDLKRRFSPTGGTALEREKRTRNGTPARSAHWSNGLGNSPKSSPGSRFGKRNSPVGRRIWRKKSSARSPLLAEEREATGRSVRESAEQAEVQKPGTQPTPARSGKRTAFAPFRHPTGPDST